MNIKRYTKARHWPLGLISLALIAFALIWSSHFTRSINETKAEHNQAVSIPPLPRINSDQPQLVDDPDYTGVQIRSGILIDVDSAQVLFAENAHLPVSIASTTKLMTALIVRRHLDLEQVIEITPEQSKVIGSKMGLVAGEKISVHSLLAGLMIASGNDAATALAETTSGSIEIFVTEMNKTARELGLKNTQYFDPAGLNDEGQSTAFDLSVLARETLKDPVIAELARTPTITITSSDGRIRHELKNSNRLVSDFAYLGAIGLKTGFTPEAGHCLVAAAERDGHTLLAVVLRTDEDTITASAIEARKLLDWGWENIRWRKI